MTPTQLEKLRAAHEALNAAQREIRSAYHELTGDFSAESCLTKILLLQAEVEIAKPANTLNEIIAAVE